MTIEIKVPLKGDKMLHKNSTFTGYKINRELTHSEYGNGLQNNTDVFQDTIYLKDEQDENEQMKLKILTNIFLDPRMRVVEPKVIVKNCTIILHGIVDSYWKKALIEQSVADEAGYMYVENNLTVIPIYHD